jgi:ABC-type Zn2+ transport system substrate-binding protein/surface adhesin
MKLTVSLVSLAALCVACGGSTPPAAAPTETTGSPAQQGEGHGDGHGHGHGHGHHDGKDHHANLSAELKDFHHVIAPVWHTEAGAARVEKACASTKDMAAKAEATKDAELVAAVSALETACAADGKPEVEAKLSAVHDRFHALAKIEKHD